MKPARLKEEKCAQKLINGVALVLALAAGQALAETPKNTLVVADAIDDIITLDPGEVSEVGGVLAANQIYQPLLTAATDGSSKIIGVLAESWTASPDGKSHTFKMRPPEVCLRQPGDGEGCGIFAAPRRANEVALCLHPHPVRFHA